MTGGKDRSQKVRKVREQDGSEGWSVAHESDVMSGCALEVSGATAESVTGRISSLLGKRVGEIYGLNQVSQT